MSTLTSVFLGRGMTAEVQDLGGHALAIRITSGDHDADTVTLHLGAFGDDDELGAMAGQLDELSAAVMAAMRIRDEFVSLATAAGLGYGPDDDEDDDEPAATESVETSALTWAEQLDVERAGYYQAHPMTEAEQRAAWGDR